MNSLLNRLAFALAVFVFSAQGYAAKGKTAQPLAEQILHIGNGSEPRELDPAKATGTPESHILDNLFEGLTSLDPVTMVSVPGMAESWTISKDGLIYTFKIRKDAKWSDGKDLTAQDFIYSWERLLAPATASEYAYQAYYIKNGEAYNTGKIKDPKQLGLKATDAKTLIVTLGKPTPFFLQLVAHHSLFPTPKHVIDQYPGQKWTRPEYMVSNGPFKLAEWKLNQHIKVVPSPTYWNKDLVKISAAFFYPIENQETEERTFLSGKLHQTYEVPILKIPVYKSAIAKSPKAFHPYRSDPYLGAYFYRFNVTKKPLDDARVRRALALTVDRTLICDRVTRAGEKPNLAFTPPNTAGYTAKNVLNANVTEANIKEAKKLLAEAGYPDGKGMPRVEILINTSENHQKIALAIQQMWKKNLGIDVGLYNQEWKVYLNSQKSLDYQISRAGWIGDYPDPNTFLDMWVTDGGQNNTGWSNKEYDKLISLAGSTNDRDERYRYFAKAEEILLDELPILPIYVYVQKRLVNEKLVMQTNTGEIIDYTPNIQDRRYLKNMLLVR